MSEYHRVIGFGSKPPKVCCETETERYGGQSTCRFEEINKSSKIGWSGLNCGLLSLPTLVWTAQHVNFELGHGIS